MEEICAELDTVLTEYLSLISTYQEEWKQIGKGMEGGFLKLAHAKYTMGPGRICQDQYDGRMQAFSRVLISQEADVDVNDASRKKDFQLTLTSGHLEIDGGIPNEHKDTENNNSPSSLRRRTTQETKSELKGDLTEKHSRKRILRDPLNWFGVLIPLSLRESQRHFKQGLLGMINIINLRNEILKKEVEYETLKRKKERMVTEAQAKPNNAEDYVQCD